MSPVESVWAQLRRPAVQRGVRAAVAAALAWQVAVLLPPMLSDYAYDASLGAVVAPGKPPRGNSTGSAITRARAGARSGTATMLILSCGVLQSARVSSGLYDDT